VEKLVYGGDGLGRVDGRVVLVPFVLPGERVQVRTQIEKTGLLRALPRQVLETAPERVVAPCPYFARCGGCHYQHMPYESQVAAKRGILAEALRRIGKLEPGVEIATAAGEPWHYRNRAQLQTRGVQLGYLEPRSHKLCPIESCPISSPKINAVISILKDMLCDSRWPRFVRSVELFTNEDDLQLHVVDSERPVARRFFEWCGERIPGLAAGPLEYTAAGTQYRVSRGSFFQVNRFLTDRLVELALESAAGSTALDLYAGVGLFSLPMARRFQAVTAVETGATAARDLEFNAARAGLAIRSVRSLAESYLATLAAPPDFLLADPPRAGLGKAVLEHLTRLRPPLMTIVSCDPATLARDLAGLGVAGYAIEQMTMVDLFPQTYHLETVVRLRHR
jgi:23S rRNA (uracil1939-C5)-methyltransferase